MVHVSRGFPSVPQANAETVHQLCHDSLLINPMQFINHEYSTRWHTVLDTASVVASTTQKSPVTSTNYRAIKKHLLNYRNEHTVGTGRVS